MRLFFGSHLVVLAALATVSACARPPAESDADDEANLVDSPADAEEASARIAIRSGVRPWVESLSKKVKADPKLRKDGLTECAAVAELPGAHLCASSSVRRMNEAFARATIFTEGPFGQEQGSVVSTKSETYSTALASLVGHDLRSEHLLDFWTKLGSRCKSDGNKDYCPNVRETELFTKTVLPLAEGGSSFVVIAFSTDRGEDGIATVAHEVFHAQYFLQPDYRRTVDEFWERDVAASDKEPIKEMLSSAYDVTDPVLLRNEFQAYVLMPRASEHLLGQWSATYGPALGKALESAKMSPLLVE